jgi:hypothetical protein
MMRFFRTAYAVYSVAVFIALAIILATSCTPQPSPPPVARVEASQCTPQFWAALEYAESGGNPLTMYREDGIKDKFGNVAPDKITGQPFIISEGPYSLSYKDVLVYGPACDFQFEKDRAKFLADIKGHETGPKGFKAKSPRLIHDIGRQQVCAEEIVRKLKSQGRSLGAYWGPIRRGEMTVPCR